MPVSHLLGWNNHKLIIIKLWGITKHHFIIRVVATQIFFYVHPENWGRFPFWYFDSYFSIGWFNHQLVMFFKFCHVLKGKEKGKKGKSFGKGPNDFGKGKGGEELLQLPLGQDLHENHFFKPVAASGWSTGPPSNLPPNKIKGLIRNFRETNVVFTRQG